MILRPPSLADALLMRSWRPDLDHVPTDDHLLWFAKYVGAVRFMDGSERDLTPWHRMRIALINEDGSLWICGMVRFDQSLLAPWEVSYIIHPGLRDRGLCRTMLK